VLVGEDPASQVYVRSKRKMANALGMNSFLHLLPGSTSEDKLLKLVKDLNAAPDVHGILVQLPLPAEIDSKKVVEAIDPEKDVDGLHPINAGKLLLGQNGFVPCTPLGCLHLIQTVTKDLSGLHAVVIGRSHLVGKPMGQLLLNANCTVTQAHSRTRDLPAFTRQADIIIAAVGIPHLITAEHIKDGAIIIDVGINRLEDGSLTGDVDFDDVTAKHNCAITPVPGGVGPMTIAMLMENTFQAAQNAAP
jgi:methylenetetrahydrofolate dehydrogenase (NADP+)/methenyltetrahydrofolate cyclohydrolase